MMAAARTILAALIAASVATAPASGGPTVSAAPLDMSRADQTDMPCCPPPDEDKASVACAFKCLNFVAATLPITITLLDDADGPPSSFADTILHGHVSRPIHPPPI